LPSCPNWASCPAGRSPRWSAWRRAPGDPQSPPARQRRPRHPPIPPSVRHAQVKAVRSAIAPPSPFKDFYGGQAGQNGRLGKVALNAVMRKILTIANDVTRQPWRAASQNQSTAQPAGPKSKPRPALWSIAAAPTRLEQCAAATPIIRLTPSTMDPGSAALRQAQDRAPEEGGYNSN
jgi:hypothetical protein